MTLLISTFIWLCTVNTLQSVDSAMHSTVLATSPLPFPPVPPPLHWPPLFWTDSLCLVQSLHNPSKCFLLSLFSGTTAPLLVRTLSKQPLSEVSRTNQPPNNKQNPGKSCYK